MSTLPKERLVSKTSSTPSTTTPAGVTVKSFHGQSVMVGQLPEDFLRLDGTSPPSNSNQSQLEIDEQLAASLQSQYNHQAQRQAQWASQYQANLVITCVEARLTKNYGLVNMNPYMRLRIGHTIFETKTSHKGGKNPKWNESIRCYLPSGVDTLSIEIYDECLLTSDDLIAWASFKFPSQYLNFESSAQHTFEESIVLSGKQGEDKEGVVLMVFTIKPITSASMPATNQIVSPTVYANPVPYVYAGPQFVNHLPVVVQSGEPASNLLPPPVIQIREEDVKNLQEMFPKIDVDVIKSVLTSERGNLDRAINNLLELNSTTS